MPFSVQLSDAALYKELWKIMVKQPFLWKAEEKEPFMASSQLYAALAFLEFGL